MGAPQKTQKQLPLRPAGPDTVAALLDSTNAVALAYLRRILGRMKRVDSTEQLRHESRAMTVDYMLSANGGTKRIRPLDEQSWMLGVKLTNEDRVAAVNESRSAANAERDASLYLGQVEGAFVKVQAALKQVTQLSYAAAVLGTRQVNLGVNTKNLAGVALYKKLGFVEYGLERGYLLVGGVLHDEYQMVRHVASAA